MADIPVNANDALTVVTVTSTGQVAFDYDFRADNINDLKANFKRASGAVIALVGGVDFTASGIGTATGGTITITSITDAVIGETVSIYRDTIIARPNDYSRDVFVEDLNAEQDKIFMILQEQSRDLKRASKSVLGGIGYQFSPDLQDGDTLMKMGTDIVPGPNAGDIAGAEGFAEEAKAARDEAVAAAESIPVPGVMGLALFQSEETQDALDLLGIDVAPGSFGNTLLSSASQGAALDHLGLADIAPSVKNGHIEAVPSRAWAIANYHPVTTPDYIQTAGYAAFGDFGHALYRRVGGEPSHEGKLSILLKDGTTTVWFELSERMVFPEMFGAKADDPGDGTGTDNRVAFQNAINFSRTVFMRPAATYRIGGSGLTLPRFQQLIGLGGRSASNFWVEIGQTGATRLLFTGAGTAAFTSQNPAEMLSHGGLRGFDMKVTGAFSYMMYFRECLQWHISDIGMETTSMTMHGFKSEKIAFANPSWVNLVSNVSIRLPDNSTGVVFDADWSDSIVEKCHLTGGVGSLDTGYGIRWMNNQIERSSYAGLQIRKRDGYAVKNSIMIGNSFDANVTHGIMFIVLNDTSGTRRFDTVLANNNFRTAHFNTNAAGAGTIALASNEGGPGAGQTYTVGPIMGNIELRSGVPQLIEVGTWTKPVNLGNMQS